MPVPSPDAARVLGVAAGMLWGRMYLGHGGDLIWIQYLWN